MTAFRKLKLVFASTILLTSFSAYSGGDKGIMPGAIKIIEAKDWSLWEAQVNNATVCFLQASEKDKNFLILKNKNAPTSPVEVMMLLAKNKNLASGMIAGISGLNSTIAYSDLSNLKTNFNGIPKNLSTFMQLMKSPNGVMNIRAVGGKKEEQIEIKTKGFSEMLSQMESRCNGGSSLVSSEFETNFVNAVSDNIDPTRIDMTKTGKIRSLYFAAYPVALDITTSKTELAAVLAKYQPLIDELSQNRSQANKLQNTDLPASRTALAASQKQQADSIIEIARIDATIPPLEAKVASSQKASDEARAILAPHEPEYNRITGNVNSAQTTLNDANNRLTYVETRLRDGAAQIVSLDSEADGLDRSLPQMRINADNARTRYRNAETERSNFNSNWEKDNRLRNNFNYQRFSDDLQFAQSAYRQGEIELQRIRGERDRVARDLQICRQQPMVGMDFQVSNDQLTPGGPGRGEPRPGGPGQGGGGLVPGGPGNGGGGLVPGGPGNGGGGGGLVPGEPGNGGGGLVPGGPDTPPQPVADCSRFEQALNVANAQLNQKQTEQNNLSSRAQNDANRMREIEAQIDQEVRNEYNGLVQIEDQARRESNSREVEVNNAQNRVSQIRGSDIPRLEREQTALTTEKPLVETRITESTAALNKSTQELAVFKAKTDWDRKASAVNSTGNQLAQDQRTLAVAEAAKRSEQKRLENALILEAQIKQQIDSLNARLLALNTRATQLDDTIKNLPAERGVIDQKIADLQNNLKTLQIQLLDLLK